MTRVSTAYGSVLIAALTFWLCLPCHARNTDRSRKAKAAAFPIQQTNLGNEAGGYGYEPLQALSSAADRHPNIRLIRVTWADICGSQSDTVTILYDRHFGTVKYYCSGGHNAGGNPSEKVYAHYLYTGATETVIRQAAEYEKSRDQGTKSRYGQGPYPDAIKRAPAYRNAGTSGSYYDSLLLFGCYRVKLP